MNVAGVILAESGLTFLGFSESPFLFDQLKTDGGMSSISGKVHIEKCPVPVDLEGRSCLRGQSWLILPLQVRLQDRPLPVPYFQ